MIGPTSAPGPRVTRARKTRAAPPRLGRPRANRRRRHRQRRRNGGPGPDVPGLAHAEDGRLAPSGLVHYPAETPRGQPRVPIRARHPSRGLRRGTRPLARLATAPGGLGGRPEIRGVGPSGAARGTLLHPRPGPVPAPAEPALGLLGTSGDNCAP